MRFGPAFAGEGLSGSVFVNWFKGEAFMDPTEVLEKEHDVIQVVLNAADEEIGFINDEAAVRTGRLDLMLEFFANFTYRCHHAKEEEHLFPALEEHGMSRETGLIAGLLQEHEQGHQLVDEIDAATTGAGQGEEEQLLEVRDGLRSYVELIREHIRKENENLYPQARKLLNSEEMDALTRAFATVEREEMGVGVHERYHAIAHQLTEE